MRIKPIDQRITVRPIKEKEKEKGGIIIIDPSLQENTDRWHWEKGVVLEISDDLLLDIHPGDTFFYSYLGYVELMARPWDPHEEPTTIINCKRSDEEDATEGEPFVIGILKDA